MLKHTFQNLAFRKWYLSLLNGRPISVEADEEAFGYALSCTQNATAGKGNEQTSFQSKAFPAEAGSLNSNKSTFVRRPAYLE